MCSSNSIDIVINKPERNQQKMNENNRYGCVQVRQNNKRYVYRLLIAVWRETDSIVLCVCASVCVGLFSYTHIHVAHACTAEHIEIVKTRKTEAVLIAFIEICQTVGIDCSRQSLCIYFFKTLSRSRSLSLFLSIAFLPFNCACVFVCKNKCPKPNKQLITNDWIRINFISWKMTI